MPGVLEAVASIGIAGALLALVSASLVGQARIQGRCDLLAADLFTDRQLEQLIDHATVLAGAGPKKPAPLSSLDAADVVFASDQNGDGSVSSSGAETTALEVRQSGSQAQVRIRLGKQTMTVVNADGSDALLSAFDSRGSAATPSTASWVELDVRPRTGTDGRARTLLFALPARVLP
ncbi:MAG TPA: hypothetical protein VGK20_18520 [Candidatus Binatia bacterium]|jgi:hypothetical protein